jgi:hypothetical protein
MKEAGDSRNRSFLAFGAVFNGSTSCSLEPLRLVEEDDPGRLGLRILFTDYAETLTALKAAAALSKDFRPHFTVLIPLLVPYPLPLDDPPVSLNFLCRRIGDLAAAVTSQIEAHVYLCRDPLETISQSLPSHSLIVVGAPRRRVFNRSRRIARWLRRRGHDVILIQHP